MNSKKGLSDIIATVLIVLLALAAVAIVWGFIRPTFDRTGGAIETSEKCLDAEVKVTGCDVSDGTVTVQRIKGAMDSVTAIVEHTSGATSGSTVTATVTAPTNALSTVSIAVAGMTSGTGDQARAAAVVTDSNGQPYPCSPTPIAFVCSA